MRRLDDAGLELPLALLAGAFFLMQVFQTVMLVRQSHTLTVIAANQVTPMQETTRLRQVTDALASDVALLARQGDAGAQQVVADMARQNITLRAPPQPNAQPSPPPAK